MTSRLRVTVLVDNRVMRRGLLAEHGLALWVEADDRRVLFDTGQGAALAHNAAALGIDLRSADAVVLSHGHYDHAGGLAANLAVFRDTPVYVHPAAFGRRYSSAGENGLSATEPPLDDLGTLRGHTGDVNLTAGWTEVFAGVAVTGAIPRRHAWEDVGGSFHLDAARTRPDPVADDQALCLDTGQGRVLLLGCAHAGVVNTLAHVESEQGPRPWRGVIGGLHLRQASEERLERTTQALQDRDVEVLGPMHCTGWTATMRLWQALPGRCEECAVGTSFEFR